MVVGNFMNLNGIAPMEGLGGLWNLAVIVMNGLCIQNVLDMVFFVSGGVKLCEDLIYQQKAIIYP